MEKSNIFAGSYLNRYGYKRIDQEWLKKVINDSNARFLPIWKNKCLCHERQNKISFWKKSLLPLDLKHDELILLGIYKNKPIFTFQLNQSNPKINKNEKFHELNYLGSILSSDEANIAAHAITIIKWHQKQNFCSYCSHPTKIESAGNTQRCISSECNKIFFPEINPAIICLVAYNNKILLGRQATWPKNRYSNIAGFVEPGESLEDAVKREVFEETNIKLTQIKYHSSQPWPFPASLMLGFMAKATSNKICLNDKELEDAKWFSKEDCKSSFPILPPDLSISRQLINAWIKQN